jgi:hypothetical protein
MGAVAIEKTRSRMTFEEIDRALSGWRQRLTAIANNLLELQNDPTYRVLTGSGGATPVTLTGETAKRVMPALKPLNTVFHQFSLLQAVIDRAAQLRKDLRPVFGREQTQREIEALLLGESIQLPADALSLKDRTLLSGNGLAMRPEQLLASMAASFGEARDAVLTVSGAWDELAHEVDAAETEMQRLQATGAGGDLPRALARAEESLGEVKECVQSDPMTARAELRTRVLPALAEAAREQETRSRVTQQMASAEAAIERLRQHERDVEAAAAVRREKISGKAPENAAGGMVEPEPPSASLAVWLGRLQGRNGEERPEAIARGLENWHQALNQAIARNVQALQQERAPLELRSELRGRLDALKAKARVYGVAEDAAVAGLAKEAERLLYAKPTPLAQAAVAVEAYERRLARPAPAKPRETDSSEERR